MSNVNCSLTDGLLKLSLSGHIDSANAPAAEEEIRAAQAQGPVDRIVIDCEDLQYISSAGLRVILRLRKAVKDTSLVNVSPEVYEVFEMTGFTEMMDIKKAYRRLSVEGCEVIGQGANGKVYRIDPDTIVKVYLNPDALPEIHKERELARLAFVAGLPTAIPYDVVRIEGGGYGSVFELLSATSFAKLLIRGEKTKEEIAELSARLLRLIHSRQIKSDVLPNMKTVALGWAEFLVDYLPAEEYRKLHALIEAVPENAHLLHGDFHLKNIMLQGDESLLIDMDTLCHGHPIFELGSMYNAYIGFGLADPEATRAFLGISPETCAYIWRRSLALYLGTDDEQKINEVEDKARLIGLTRLMRREIRRNGLNREDGRRMIEICRAGLSDLLPRIDTLEF